VPSLYDRIGSLLDQYAQDEYNDYFTNSGYARA
jgi:hypothetical protein